uniref:ADP-ribosylation factor-like protein 9 n=1 Tax=Scophthalmus maximus TaxID=52904 RepID=A0A8D3A4H7_SCOMX
MTVCLLSCLSVGGKEALRPFWPDYLQKALLLVYVVDSSSPQLLPLAKKHLHELLTSDPHLPLMVLANQQVNEPVRFISTKMSPHVVSVGRRRLFLIGTHVKKGEAELSSGLEPPDGLL